MFETNNRNSIRILLRIQQRTDMRTRAQQFIKRVGIPRLWPPVVDGMHKCALEVQRVNDVR